jgi:aspartate oxidase
MREDAKVVSRKSVEPKAAYSNGPVDAGVEDLIAKIQAVMETDIGIVRTRMGMQQAIKTLEEMTPKLAHPKTRRACEAAIASGEPARTFTLARERPSAHWNGLSRSTTRSSEAFSGQATRLCSCRAT